LFVPGTALEIFLKIIAVICAALTALVTGSPYLRGIRDDIDVQEKPTGIIKNGLLPQKALGQLRVLDTLFTISPITMEDNQSTTNKLVKPNKYLLSFFLEF